ncbi:WW domain-binding protein 11 [Puntigrus tetrazona]|uniref:WW domain-binding protein 11 n=1 Tax=Puntigrus tetrazona TaxID=1606681 RepID=UPI001C89E241|nr:WW domain-binding protein 11 [Puntigrus tetrazona]
MGRRSTSSTKSGKFMNPTDQARKEARKRELKKNKKQRMMVRAAVLKMKDPRQIIRDMEKLDEMEFNPVQQPLLNEKVLRDKRKKLRETFERIVRLYERENPEMYKELRKLEVEYETKRGQLSLYFDSVKNAESVEVDSIPLPDMPHAPSSILIQDIPLPGAQPPSILKKNSALGKGSALSAAALAGVPRLPPGRKPPGPPPGPPPAQVLQLYANTRRTEGGGSDSEMMDTGGRDSDRDSDADDDSDSQDDSGAERDDADVDPRMMSDRHGDRDEERDRGDKHTGRSVRFADMPPPKEKRKRRVMKTKSITPLQAMMLRMAGQSIPEDEEEDDEEEYTDSEESDAEDQISTEATQSLVNPRLSVPAAPMAAQQPPPHMQAPPITGPPPLGPPPAPPMRPPGPPSGPPPGPPPGAPPFLRPPGLPAALRGPMPRMLPPGPPPGRPPGPLLDPTRSAPGPQRTPPRLPPQPLVRMPPAPPPRMAPPLSLFPPPLNPNVLSAPPSIRQKSPVATTSSSDSAPLIPPARGSAHQMPPPPGTTPTIEKRATVSGPGASLAPPGGATISAKPQIINPKTEVTRFVPTALRVRRDRAPGRRDEEPPKPAAAAKPSQPPGAAPPGLKTKDQMYEAFMREMEGLL